VRFGGGFLGKTHWMRSFVASAFALCARRTNAPQDDMKFAFGIYWLGFQAGLADLKFGH
jgi:hypothetical protein